MSDELSTSLQAAASSQMTAKKKKPIEELGLKELLNEDAIKNQIARALPNLLPVDRFLRVAITTLTKTPALLKCTQASFMQSLLTLAQVGLEPDGRHAHLIPYGNQCQLIIDYKGLVLLMMRSGLVSAIHADVVCENDEFEYNRGILETHRINFKKTRGNPYAVYAICRFKDGTEKIEVMHLEEVEKVRQRSKAGKNGPWVTDYNEMCKKTVFRRLTKWVSISPEIHEALEKDHDSIDFDANGKADAEEELMEALNKGETINLNKETGEVYD